MKFDYMDFTGGYIDTFYKINKQINKKIKEGVKFLNEER